MSSDTTPLRVLILEDRVDDAELMALELERAGFATEWQRVDSESDYLALLQPGMRLPDIILADYTLPQFDALHALHLLQERGLDIPFVVITATVGEEVVVECMRQGASDYLLKDRLARLGLAASRALEAKQARDEQRRAEAARAELAREHTARQAAEAAQRRFAFLAEASRQLASSLEYSATLEAAARMAVPSFADVCFVDIVDERIGTRRSVLAVAEPHQATVLCQASEQGLLVAGPARPEPALRQSKEVVYLAATSPDVLAEALGDATRQASEAQRAALASLAQPASLIVAPLDAREHVSGAIIFVRSGARARFESDDAALAEEYVRRCAMAVDNAHLHQELQLALHTRDEFLAAAAHDLKNPLTSIKGNAQLLRRDLTRRGNVNTEREARLLRGLTNIETAAVKMTRQLDELLDLARLQMGAELALNCQPTDLVGLVRQAVAEHQATTKLHHIQFETRESSLISHSDAARLARVLDNVLGNALKFSPSGGKVMVRMKREPTRATEVDGASQWAILTVQDEGVGIPVVDLPRIFDRFYRAGNVIGRIGGTGIGLAAVRQIVEQHGGTVRVHSQEGKGTTISVRLPLLPPVQAEASGEGGLTRQPLLA